MATPDTNRILRHHWTATCLGALCLFFITLAATGCATGPAASGPASVPAPVCVEEVPERARAFGPAVAGVPDSQSLAVLATIVEITSIQLGHYDARCSSGDALACTLLGLVYYSPAGDEDRYPTPEKARTPWAKACKAEFAPACTLLSSLESEDDERRVGLVERGCLLGDGLACRILLDDVGPRDDSSPEWLVTRVYFLERSCDQGYPASCYFFGMLAWEERADAECHRHFMGRACTAGDRDACHRLSIFGATQDCEQFSQRTGADRDEGQIATACALAQTLEASSVEQDGPITYGWHAAWRERCFSGDSAACNLMGLLFLAGGYVEVEPQDGARFLELACERSYLDACGEASLVRWARFHDVGGAEHLARGFELARRGCDGGVVQACEAGLQIAYGRNIEVEEAFAVESVDGQHIVRRACELGIGFGCIIIGSYDLDWVTAADQKRAVDHLVKGCQERGGSDCMVAAGAKARLHGRASPGVKMLLAQGCESGSQDACDGLSSFDDESGPVLADIGKLEVDCQARDFDACFQAAQHYADGRQVKADEARAMLLWDHACGRDHIESCLAAGRRHFFQGLRRQSKERYLRGVALLEKACALDATRRACFDHGASLVFGLDEVRDPERGMKILGESCDGGSPEGCVMLAELAYNGAIEPADLGHALARFTRACELDYAPACLQVGHMHSHGEGADANAERAAEYFERACTHGFEQGCQAHRRLERQRRCQFEANLDCHDRVDEPAPVTCGDAYNVALPPEQWARRRGADITRFRDLQSTKATPVEVCGAAMQHQYLMGLACDDGSRPISSSPAAGLARRGNVGSGGRCGKIVDLYEVACPEGEYKVFMDMYFCQE